MVNSHILVFPQQVAWKWKGGGQRQEWRERSRLSCEEENAKEKRKKWWRHSHPHPPQKSPLVPSTQQFPRAFLPVDSLCLIPCSTQPFVSPLFWFSTAFPFHINHRNLDSPHHLCSAVETGQKKSFNKHQDRKEWPRMCLNKVPFLKTASLK